MKGLVLRPTKARLIAGLAYARLTGRPALLPGGPLALLELPEFELPGPRWVRVRSRLAGICGSDLKTLRLQLSPRSAALADRSPGEPLRFPGHETLGEVVEVRPGVTRLRVGQRVVMMPDTFCAALEIDPPCRHCREGNYCLCEQRDRPPAPGRIGGGWCESFVRHEAQFFPVPDAISDEQAVLFDPLGCAVRAVLRRPPGDGAQVLVVGGGTIGLGIVAVLKALGVDVCVTVLARHAFQAERARALGAEQTVAEKSEDVYEALARVLGTEVVGRRSSNRLLRRGFDFIYDAAGSAATLHQALRWVRPGGTVILEGVNQFPGILDRSPIWHREIEIVGSLGHGAEDWEGQRLGTFERLTEWLQSGRLAVDGFLTHRFGVERYREAIAAAADKARSRSIKVVFDFGVRA